MSGLFGDDLAPEPEPELASSEHTAAPLDHSFEMPAADTLLPAREMSYCLAHEAIEQQFLDLIQKGQVPHALIFSGLKGIGKATFAHRLAKYLLVHDKGSDDAQDALFGGEDLPEILHDSLDVDTYEKDVRLYVQGAHPDCRVIERAYDDTKNRYKDAVDVGEIRKIAPFLRMASSDGGWRIVVIDDADTMNRNAQNAILKILEEPPKKTLIVLIAHRAGALIPTIHSRARRIHFSALSDETMRTLLQKAEAQPDEEQIDQLIGLGQGSVGAALDMLSGGGLEAFEMLEEMLSAYPRLDWTHIHKASDILTKSGQDQSYKMLQVIVCKALEACTLAKAKERPLPAFAARISAFNHILNHRPLTEIVTLSDEVQAHFNQSNFANLDKKQTLLYAMRLIAA